MISNPKHGWCTFELENFTGRASYLTNVPVETLEQFINYWENTYTLSIFFDEEGSTFTLVANPYSIYIIEEKDEPKLINIDKHIENLTLELINDIEKDIDKWASEFVIDEAEVEENKNIITSLLNKLKEIVAQKNIKYK